MQKRALESAIAVTANHLHGSGLAPHYQLFRTFFHFQFFRFSDRFEFCLLWPRYNCYDAYAYLVREVETRYDQNVLEYYLEQILRSTIWLASSSETQNFEVLEAKSSFITVLKVLKWYSVQNERSDEKSANYFKLHNLIDLKTKKNVA